MDIKLSKKNNTYIYDCTQDTTISVRTIESGQYFCCFIVYDAILSVDIASDIADAQIQVVCISYANKQGHTRISVNGKTSQDGVHIDMTMLSLASEGGVLDVTGAITMPPGVKKTQGYLLEENILLHPSARIKALPMLDVRSNDVQASHGAKIHAIDDIKLFYMQARGLSHAESKKLYIQGYIQNIFDKIPSIQPEFVQEQQDRILVALTL